MPGALTRIACPRLGELMLPRSMKSSVQDPPDGRCARTDVRADNAVAHLQSRHGLSNHAARALVSAALDAIGREEGGEEDGEDGEDGEGGEGEDGEDGKDEAEASAAPSAAASEAARAEDADQYDGNVSGHVYSISADGKVAYINFPANENVELFNCMCEWLKTHKSLGNKKEHISAFTMIKGKKFGQNLIAYRSNSDPAIFDVLEKGSEINFFVDEQKDKFNVKSYHAVQLSFV